MLSERVEKSYKKPLTFFKESGRLDSVMNSNSTILLKEQIKRGLDKIEKNIESQSHQTKIDNLFKSLVNIGVDHIPQFNDVDSFIKEVNDVNSIAYKIDNILASPENIKHQTGRGELSMFLMIPNSRKSNVKKNGENGDVTFDNKSYELKKESNIIDFAIKTRGDVTDKYNDLITIRTFCDKILNSYFVGNEITNYFNQYFRKKLTEFSNNDFELFDDVLTMIKTDKVIINSVTGKILLDLIKDFSIDEWRKNVAQSIINSYSGGVIVYRKKKKGNRKIKRIESKYELLNANNVIVQNLTLGNIQLKIIS